MMNDKEKELWRILDNTIKCCAVEVAGTDTLSITRADVLGKSRAENLVMTRCILATQLQHAGYSITTIAGLLNRTVPAVRHLPLDCRPHRHWRNYRLGEVGVTNN